MPSSICLPPAASAPERTVRKPMRIGSDCPCDEMGTAAAAAAQRPMAILKALRSMVCPWCCDGRLRFEIPGGRKIARVDRIRQELLRLVGPELACVRISLRDGIDQLAVAALDLADEERHDRVAVLVEPPLAARVAHHAGIAQRLHEGFLVLDPAFH